MRIRKATMGALALAGALTLSFASPAHAVDVPIVKVGGSTKVGASNIWKVGSKTKVLRSVGTFSNLTSKSVKLVKLEICFSVTGGGDSALVSPTTFDNKTQNIWDGGLAKTISSGTCRTWNVNRVYPKKSDGSLFQLNNRVDAGGRLEIIGFNR